MTPAPSRVSGAAAIPSGAADRYLAALRLPAPAPPVLPQRVSSSGTSWARPGAPSLQFLRAAALLRACGMDADSVTPAALRQWLDALHAAKAVSGPVEAAAAAVSLESSYLPGGFLSKLAAYPVVAGLGTPGVPRLCPVAVLSELRRPGDATWRHAFAVALIGAPAELRRPVPRFPFRGNGRPACEAADPAPLLQRDLDNGWILPAAPGTPVPAPSPVSTVAKANGAYRLICDDSSRSGKGVPRGPNGFCDTTRLPFPATVSVPAVAGWLRAAPPPPKGGRLWLCKFDVATAFRRLGLSALGRGSSSIKWAGTVYRVTTCSMGSRWSSSAMNAVTHAVARSLNLPGGRARVLSYCDDCLAYVSGTRAEAVRFRARVIERFGKLGLPMVDDKCPPPSVAQEWIGLAIDAGGSVPTIAFSESAAASLSAALASVVARRPVDAAALRLLLGRLGWLSCVAPPVRLWLRRLYQALGDAASGSRFSKAAASAAARLDRLFVRRVWPVDEVCRRVFPDPHPRFVVFSDASATHGGGLVYDAGSRTSGVLHSGERGSAVGGEAVVISYPGLAPASTRSELLTVQALLAHASARMRGHSVRLFTDSLAAKASVHGRAAPGARHADDLGEALAMCVLDNRIYLHAEHIAGLLNGSCDSLSRYALASGRALPLALPAGAARENWRGGLVHVWARLGPLLRKTPATGVLVAPPHVVVTADARFFGQGRGPRPSAQSLGARPDKTLPVGRRGGAPHVERPVGILRRRRLGRGLPARRNGGQAALAMGRAAHPSRCGLGGGHSDRGQDDQARRVPLGGSLVRTD